MLSVTLCRFFFAKIGRKSHEITVFVKYMKGITICGNLRYHEIVNFYRYTSINKHIVICIAKYECFVFAD